MDNSFVKDSMENHQLVKLFYTEFEESRKRACKFVVTILMIK